MLNKHYTHQGKGRYINKGGYTLSEETKVKMRGRVPTPELLEVYRIKAKEFQSRTNQLANLAKSKKGIPRSDEIKRKISEATKGKKRSDETKRKISENSKNVSSETRKKYRQAKIKKVACRLEDKLELNLVCLKRWLKSSNEMYFNTLSWN